MDAKRKSEIDRLINIYLNAITSINNDAGWSGSTILARLIEFNGELPQQTGNDQSNLSMILAIEKIRSTHFDYPKIKTVIQVLTKSHPEQAQAICASMFYNGACVITGKTYRDEDRARAIEQGLHSYRYNLKKAYYSINSELERLDTFICALSAA